MIYRIGPLRLTVTPGPQGIRYLFHGQEPVELTPKAVRMLEVFASRPEQILSQDDLRAAIWPAEHVEDGNIRRHVSLVRTCLREHLGEGDHIIRISKQGYQLTVPVTVEEDQPPQPNRVPDTSEVAVVQKGDSRTSFFSGKRSLLGSMAVLILVAGAAFGGWKLNRSLADARQVDNADLPLAELTPLPPLPPALHPTPENLTRPALVILDLANNSTSKADDWLGTAMREVLWMDFSASEGIKVVNGQCTFDGEVDLDLPLKVYDDVVFGQIGKRFDADSALVGTYKVDGPKIHVDMELVRIEDRSTLANVSFDATEQTLLPSLAAAVNQFRTKLRLPPAVTPAGNVLPLERGFASLRPFAEGVRLQRLGFPTEAHPPLVKAAKLSPLSPMAHLELSRNAAKVGMPDLAASEAHFAIQTSNGLPEETKLYVRARVHYYAGQYAECAQDYRQLIQLRPDDHEYTLYLGECYNIANQPERELATITPYLKLHDFRFDLQAARDYVALNDWENAKKYAEAQIRDARAVNSVAGVSYGLATRGYVKAHLGDLPGAMEDFKQSIALAEPKHLYWELARAYGMLATAQSNTKDMAGMLANTQKMLAIWQHLGEKRNVLYAMERVADAQRTMHDFDAAKKTLLDALAFADRIENEGYAAEINLSLAQLAIETNDLKSAADYAQVAFSKATAIGDRDTAGEAQGLLGDIALGQGDVSAARTSFLQGLDLASQTKQNMLRTSMLMRLAKLETSVGNPDAAAKWQAQMVAKKTSKERAGPHLAGLPQAIFPSEASYSRSKRLLLP